MNVFDDLIDELRADDLLETSLIRPVPATVATRHDVNSSETDEILKELTALEELGDSAFTSNPIAAAEIEIDLPDIQKPVDERDFFRKRATDEVSSLQMVEHVISGIEREHLKMIPVPFNDLEVKKALHRFLQVSDNLESSEHAEAEFLLLQETEGWSSALEARDQDISVANIRRFCENSRPILSSQALMALARFYRNSPYSEPVRGKFDVVMTRLFSRDVEDEKRRLLFTRSNMVGHIKMLYGNWSSILVYSAEDNEAEISLVVSGFDALIMESERAETFDELLEVDFFNRIRLFKEGAAEKFYVPEVSATAMECNVRVGNKYVDLIFSERAKTNAAMVEQKYGYTYDQINSDATSKTLLLVNLSRAKPADVEQEVETVSFDEVFPDKRPALLERPNREKKSSRFEIFAVNKWFMAAAIVLILLSTGVYFWAENASTEKTATPIAATINLSTSDINQHLKLARGSSSETFYGLLQPTWDAMSEDEQKAFLQKVYSFSLEKGYKRVTLMNGRGRTVAFASKEKLEVFIH